MTSQERALTTVGPQTLATAQTETDWLEVRRVLRGMVARNVGEAEIDAIMMVAQSSGFNPVLGHLIPVDGKPYVTHKGLWNLAHRSGMLDGIEVLAQEENETHHLAKVAIWRKDMRLPFTFWGRYAKSGRNKQYGPEMALVRAECMALRRAFDVSLPVHEEINWAQDGDQQRGTVTVVEVPPAQLAPPEGMPHRAFVAFIGDLDRDAADGLAGQTLAHRLKAARPAMTATQRGIAMEHWARIKAARQASVAPIEAAVVEAAPVEAADLTALMRSPEVRRAVNDTAADDAPTPPVASVAERAEQLLAYLNERHPEAQQRQALDRLFALDGGLSTLGDWKARVPMLVTTDLIEAAWHNRPHPGDEADISEALADAPGDVLAGKPAGYAG